MDIKKYIKTIPNFPREEIMFRDITPLLATPKAFNYVIDKMSKIIKDLNPDLILAPEARGFIFACPIAIKLNIGFIPIRKPGKLPREVISCSYKFEYGLNSVEIHKDDIKPGQKIVLVDDLLATAGTIKATIKLVEQLGAHVVGCIFLINLKDLKGIEKLKDYNTKFLLEY